MLPTTKHFRKIVNSFLKENEITVYKSYTDKLKGDKRKIKFMLYPSAIKSPLEKIVAKCNAALVFLGYEDTVKFSIRNILGVPSVSISGYARMEENNSISK